MLRNYFKIAWRNLLKYRAYSIINIFGLMIGIACFLVIALYVFDELTFDRFHRNSDNIYRIVEEKTSETGKQSKVAAVPFQLSEQSTGKLPGVIDKVRLAVRGRSLVRAKLTDNGFQEEYWLMSPNFLEFFDFKMIAGDRKTALREPKSLVVTAETAIKYFGTTDVMGKTLTVGTDTNGYTIKGVLENFPANSHIAFNMVSGESTMNNQGYLNFINNDWTSNAFFTYVVLDKNADIKKMERQMEQMLVENRRNATTIPSKIFLQSLKDIHFYSNDIESTQARTGIRAGGNIMYIYVFSIVAVFILLIACINYINLTTARFANRAKEIAVRKVAGADRQSIMLQFLSEAMLMTLIALALALTLVKFTLPLFNNFSGKDLYLGFAMDYRIWIGILCIAILAGLSSGIYPAFIQSGFKPFMLLKNKVNFGKGNLSIRRSLVVFQFTLSIIMIVATMVVYLQLQYVNKKDMGFNKEQLVVMDINSGAVRRGAETFKTEYAKLPGVISVTSTSRVPGEWKVIPKVKIKQQSGNSDLEDMYFICADENFFKTYEITLGQGRNFTSHPLADSASVIINETAAKQLGITTAGEQLVSMPLSSYGGNEVTLDQPFVARVVGIVKDFNFQSLHIPVAPLIIAHPRNPIESIDYYTVKISPVNIRETLKRMEDILHTVDRGHMFEYHFLDKQWDLFYREDQKRQTIFLGVAILTILIACLGLFGLATYAAEQRIKEIGIRKVLGASVTGIVTLLSKDFIKLVGVAALIALPVSWWAMNNWLKNFAFRIDIGWWVFAVAAVVAVLIAIFTVSYQAIRAATANPVKSLRAE
jgi:putative ABC transport system permease protein